MPQIYVALDLETTGLDPHQDEIIEVGAVKFSADGVLDTFCTFTKPRRLIPYAVELLTGIRQQDVEAAPPFAAVAGDLLLFVGEHPIVAQNASFDLGFLKEHGLELTNPVFDTLELARILVPQLSERNLTALALHFDVPYPVKHRAVPDATATKDVLLGLRALAKGLEPVTLSRLSNLGNDTPWRPGVFFQEVLTEAVLDSLDRGAAAPKPAATLGPPMPLKPEKPTSRSETPGKVARTALDVEQLEHLLSLDGPIARSFPGFEHRPEQVRLLRSVAEALNGDQHLLAEAGTGTGKSMAYLLPALVHAVQNDTQVVISTNTIALQEQIIAKDIPMLLRALAQAGPLMAGGELLDPASIKYTQLKGRANYLCPRRWNSLANSGTLDPSFAARITVWLGSTVTGDRAELSLNGVEQAAWGRVSAAAENCPAGQCLMVKDGVCFLQKARQRAAEAHLLVVNHALLVSDLAAGNTVLPEYDYLVIDEAHHLEDVATDQLGFALLSRDFHDLMDRVSHEASGRPQGFLPGLQSALRTSGTLLGASSDLLGHALAVANQLPSARQRVTALFTTLHSFLRAHGEGSAEYGRRVRLTSGNRRQPAWSPVEQAWEDTRLVLQDVYLGLGRVHGAMEGLSDFQVENYDDLLAESAALHFACQELLDHGRSIIAQPDNEWVCWLAAGGREDEAGMYAAPIEVGPLLQRDLFNKKTAVVLTSATLRTRDTFDYVKGRIGLEDPLELAVESSFPYKEAALLLLPRDLPDPQHPQHARVLEQALADLCLASQGRALVLFTSYSALQTAFDALRGLLQPAGIRVLAQGISGTPHQMLAALRSNSKTVLLGTSSFWEGVDVVGDALSLLVITRLPFTVPTEPVFAARSERFEDPFRDYAVPQAVLRFRQGFGRLIRSKTDRGVAVVLDPRVQGKSYGASFLQSLPPASVRPCVLREAPRLVREWLGIE